MNYEQLKELIIKTYGSFKEASLNTGITYKRLIYALNSSKGLRLKEIDVLSKNLMVKQEDFNSIFFNPKVQKLNNREISPK